MHLTPLLPPAPLWCVQVLRNVGLDRETVDAYTGNLRKLLAKNLQEEVLSVLDWNVDQLERLGFSREFLLGDASQHRVPGNPLSYVCALPNSVDSLCDVTHFAHSLSL